MKSSGEAAYPVSYTHLSCSDDNSVDLSNRKFVRIDQSSVSLEIDETATVTAAVDDLDVYKRQEYAQLYGSYIHPLSVTGDNLYFTMSMWMPYNVF